MYTKMICAAKIKSQNTLDIFALESHCDNFHYQNISYSLNVISFHGSKCKSVYHLLLVL